MFFKMRARDVNCGPLTYRTWVVRGIPDFTGASYAGPFCGMSVNFADVVVAATWGDLESTNDLLPAEAGLGSLGADNTRWHQVFTQNLLTGDLEMRSPDGLAHWVLREQPDGISAHNKRSGESFRFTMERVDP